MTIKKTLVLATGLLAASGAVLPYEIKTHAALTYNAYRQSKLGTDPAIARDLGIDWLLVDPSSPAGWDPTFKSLGPFGEDYMDTNSMSGSSSRRRVHESEAGIIEGDLGVPSGTLPAWLMRGAIREDDGGSFITGWRGQPFGDPYGDPYGDFKRYCNHFFDPTKSFNRAASTALCWPDVKDDAANWALGTMYAFSESPSANSARRNHFSVPDAREALYRAVTGRTGDGTSISNSGRDADFAARKSYYATMFRALGDVLHVNQDMGQPQHTRDESHAGIGGHILAIGGNPAYEERINVRASVRRPPRGPDGQVIPVSALTYGGYAPPRFARLSDYWSTDPGLSPPSGKGLADYSNREFFTPDNNYGSTRYLSPPSDPGRYSEETRTTTVPGFPYPLMLTVTYLRGTVTDNQTSTHTPTLLTMRSVWNDFVSGAGFTSAYTQDNVIFDEMASQLVPRAVGYSAGILDYFFRGKMQITPPDGGAYAVLDHSKTTINPDEVLTNFKGFGKFKIKLAAPANGNDDQPQNFRGGQLLAVLKFRRNTCFDKDLTQFVGLAQPGTGGKPKYETCRTSAEEIIVSDPVNGGASFTPTSTPQALTLNFPKQLPLNATDVRLQVIYRGKLGAEDDDVVVATKDLSEPTYFSYINASDYSAIDTGTAGVQVFTREQIAGDESLLQKVYPQSCVDKTVSPWQLKSSCLQPFDVRLGLRVGAFKIDVPALPVRRLVRIAFLGTADTQVSLAQAQENTCYPHLPFNVDTSEWQSNPDSSNNPTTAYSEFQKIRGVWGWYGTSCVGNADGLTPGTPDNRNSVMANLSDTEKVPFEVTIDDGDVPVPPAPSYAGM